MGKFSERLIELAQTYLGDVEVGNNDGVWLKQLMNHAGNPTHWVPGESYCIAALCSLMSDVCKEQGVTLPFPLSLSTRGFFDGARDKKWAVPMVISGGSIYARGDIAIFSDGNSWQGHAALITGVTPEGLSTIEFNTSDTNKGDQRNGGGCFAKNRLFSKFGTPTAHGLWLRGSVKVSNV